MLISNLKPRFILGLIRPGQIDAGCRGCHRAQVCRRSHGNGALNQVHVLHGGTYVLHAHIYPQHPGTGGGRRIPQYAIDIILYRCDFYGSSKRMAMYFFILPLLLNT